MAILIPGCPICLLDEYAFYDLSIYSAYLAIRFEDLLIVPPLGRVLPLFEIFIHLGLDQSATLCSPSRPTWRKFSTCWGRPNVGSCVSEQEFVKNITYLVCFLLTKKIFLSTEIRNAGVMIQLPTIHYLNTYFRMFITLSIKFYSFKHRSYSTAKRVVWNNL